MANGYLTVQGRADNVTVIERSKFICSIKGVENEDDAKNFIEQIRKEQSLATHNCYAYIADDLGLIQKFSDNGEPQGTAGMPMLDVLKNRKIFKTVAVVTRYFGGIKLGTGGLVRAYGGAVSDCLEKAKIVSMEKVFNLCVYTDFGGYSPLLKAVTNDWCKVIDTNFTDKISVRVAVKCDYCQSLLKKLSDIFKGSPSYTVLGEDYAPF